MGLWLKRACNLYAGEKEFFHDYPLVRIHFIIVMIRWTGLAPREFEFPFPGSLTSTFLVRGGTVRGPLTQVGLLVSGDESAIERVRHIHDSQGQILALTFR